MKKPFVVLLNTIHPYSESTKQLAAERKKISDKSATNEFRTDEKEDIYEIIKSVLMEFDFINWILCSKMDRDVKERSSIKMELLLNGQRCDHRKQQ